MRRLWQWLRWSRNGHDRARTQFDSEAVPSPPNEFNSIEIETKFSARTFRLSAFTFHLNTKRFSIKTKTASISFADADACWNEEIIVKWFDEREKCNGRSELTAGRMKMKTRLVASANERPWNGFCTVNYCIDLFAGGQRTGRRPIQRIRWVRGQSIISRLDATISRSLINELC